jgi:transcriptional regulator with XRE-family HTH domain
MFNSRLRELRKERLLTQKIVGSGVKMCQSKVCELERGIATPNMWDLMEFARFFGVSVDYLVGLTDKRERA